MARRSWTRVVLAGLGIALAVSFAFAGVAGNGFINWDDNVYITGNPHVRALSSENLAWMWRNTLPQWGPLAFLLHAVDVRLFGMDAAAHHRVSLALHAIASVLVLLLFLALTRDRIATWSENARLAGGTACALLFALHPLRVESVAWASEQKDLLCGIFMLAALLAWLAQGTARSPGSRLGALVAAHVAVALALLAKPMAVTLPVLLLLLDLWPLQRLSLATLPRRLAENVLMLAAVAFVIHTTLAPPPSDVPRMRVGIVETSARALLPLRAATFHLEKTLWPAPLAAFYPTPPAERRRLADPEFALSALALVLVTAGAAWRWRGERYWLVAWAFYLVALSPVSGLVPLAGQIGADRFTYIPTLPVFLLAGAAVASAWSRPARTPTLAAVAAILVLSTVVTRRQIAVWRDSETFWEHIVSVFPGQVVMAHNNLGAIHHERGMRTGSPQELVLAEAQYRQAIALVPRHANAWNNLGLVHQQRGEWVEAERCYRQALAIAPKHPQAKANLARLLAARPGPPPS